MAFETLRLDVDEGGVATLTLNRPERMNAFNKAMTREVQHAWRAIGEDDAIRAVIIAGAGERAFCTGLDVSEGPWFSDVGLWDQVDPGQWLSPKRNRVWKPVVCAVQGIACGGAIYFLADAEVVVASSDATFFFPQLSLGVPAGVEPVLLMGRVGYAEAARMTLMGAEERVSAATALRIGLVNEVTPQADLAPRARELARTMARANSVLSQAVVRALWEANEGARTAALANGLKIAQLSTAYAATPGPAKGGGSPWNLR